MKRQYKPLLSILLSLFLLFSFQGSKNRTTRPNIIIVYFDDMGYGDLSRTGAIGYETPNIDQMAKEGLFFSHFYSPQAVCTASRAGLLTGCYPNRIGFSGAMDHTSKVGLNPSEETIAELLKKQGYSTAAYGKWHLGHLPEFLPTKNGFDEYFGLPYSNDMWPNHPTAKNYYPPLPLIENDKVIATNPDQSQFTTQFTEKTIGFIQKNKDKPFFVYLAHPMPHVPLFVSDKFKGKSQQGLFGDVLMELDWSIGQIRKTLADLKLDDNTILIVTSDNGPWFNYGNHSGSAGGFREGKGTTWEGGQRVPCLMTWKGVIPEGVVCNNISSGLDILPTIAEVTGASLSNNKIDGVSLWKLLQGDFREKPRDTFLYYYRANNLEAVRHGKWKLVFPHPGRTYEGFSPGKDGLPGAVNENYNITGGLFDLSKDPGERYNVQFDFPEVTKTLIEIADKAREDLGDDLQGKVGKNRRPIGRREK